MTTSLAPRTGLPGTLLEQGYDLPADLSYDEWAGVLLLAEHIEAASPWWVADAIAYGRDRFGEDYTQALPTSEDDPHGVRQSRLKQAAWMAEKYPRNQRVPGLSYTHHRAAAELPADERQAVLQEAVLHNLSTRQLIERVKDRQAAITAESRAVDGATCAAESAAWVPTVDDLTDDARAALAFKAGTTPGVRDRGSFEAGWIAALHWSEQRDCFEEWGE